MGDSKTVNQDLLIATKGTLHSAETPTPTDLLHTKDKSKKVNHHNYIITAKCDDSEATQKTLIRRHRIIHLASRIGQDFGSNPSDYQGTFVGEGGGVYNGGVHHKHAKATQGSPNVIVENQPLIRTDDPTEQNRSQKGKHNTNGKVIQRGGALTEDELEALLAKGCTVESVTTSCSHAKDGTPRTATTDRLEVIEGDVVKLVMVHVNDAEVDPAHRAKPKCQVPRRKKEGKLPAEAKSHPLFRVQRGAYPATSYREALPAIAPEEIPGLEIELGERWLGKKPEPPSNFSLSTSPGKPAPADPNAPKGLVQRASDALTPDKRTSLTPGGMGPRPSGEAQRAARTQGAATPEQYARAQADNRAEEARERESAALRQDIGQRAADQQQAALDESAKAYEHGKAKLDALKKSGALFLESWRAIAEVWAAKPVEVKIEALACAGARPVTIAAYPPKKYAADLMSVKEVKKAFQVLKDVISGVRKFLALLGKDNVAEKEEGADAPAVAVGLSGKRFTVSISFLSGAAASLWMQYRELERDAGLAGEKKYKRHEVKLAFGVDFTVKSLIGIKFKYEVPLAIALGPLGKFIQEVLDRLDEQQKSGAFVSFDVELSVGLSGGIERDQYGKAWLAKSGAITPTIRFTLSLVVAVGDYFRFEIGVTLKWSPSFKLTAHNDKPFEVVRDPGNIEIKWFVKVGVKILGWTVEFDYSDFIMNAPILGGPVVIS